MQVTHNETVMIAPAQIKFLYLLHKTPTNISHNILHETEERRSGVIGPDQIKLFYHSTPHPQIV